MSHKVYILIVEDNPDHAELASFTLEKNLYECETVVVRTMGECLDLLKARKFDVILVDYYLQGADGLMVIEGIRGINEDVPIIVVTGLGTENVAVEAMRRGAYDYIVKSPGYLELLPITVSKALKIYEDAKNHRKREEEIQEKDEQYRTLVDNINIGVFRGTLGKKAGFLEANHTLAKIFGYASLNDFMKKDMSVFFSAEKDLAGFLEKTIQQGFVKDEVYCAKKADGCDIWVSITVKVQRSSNGDIKWVDGTVEDITARKTTEDALANSMERLKNFFIELVEVLAATSEIRDPFTAGHQKRVAELACRIGQELGLSEEQIQIVHMCSLIHDIGKIQVPIEVLINPRKLTDLEFKMIKMHSRVGFDILKSVNAPWPLARVILQHHERINGSGYPDGLKGDDILLEAKIVAVSDVVEAMASHRPYRPALGIEKALDEIRQNRGTLYEPKVVDACLKIFAEGFKFSEK
ncbi:MAG TPA: response regulator [Candidatus Omnitrophota bacterium]|nr:response regulator [Candidatus Omnitrophota bacterium]